MRIVMVAFLFLLLLLSCKRPEQARISQMVTDWEEKEIVFPKDVYFTLRGQDTIDYNFPRSDYKIVSYVDSAGCISCKLQLFKWKLFISELNLAPQEVIPVILFFHPRNLEELIFILKRDKYDFPVCIDIDDKFNRLNHFPSDMAFQTFLLDRDNKVLALGNPIHNPKVKELYLKIIRGDEVRQGDKSKVIKTEVGIDNASLSLGRFDWHKEEKASFTLRNTGDKPLVIQDVVTSCGCTSVSYSPEPVLPGRDIALEVTYKAEHPEHFNKTITVYCNAVSSPIILKISGNAK